MPRDDYNDLPDREPDNDVGIEPLVQPLGDVSIELPVQTRDNHQNTYTDKFKAYGDIQFDDIAREVKFIGLASDTEPKIIVKHIKEEWELKLPRLIISVTGSGKYYHMDSNVMQDFKDGISAVVEKLTTWVISAGCSNGITAHVGEALCGTDTAYIGISRWSDIEGISNMDVRGETVKYTACFAAGEEKCVLDRNQTHFLLENGDNYNGQIKVRTELESHMMKYSQGVLLVLGGGLGTLEDIYAVATKEDRMPVILIKGSGRIADLLSYEVAEKNKTSEDEKERLLEKLMIFSELKNDKEKRKETYQKIHECLMVKDLFTVADLSLEDSLEDVILQALFKDINLVKEPYKLMRLALFFDRPDIAEDTINGNIISVLKKEILKNDETMIIALAMDRIGFVKLLLRYALVDLTSLVTTEVLEFLYFYRYRYQLFEPPCLDKSLIYEIHLSPKHTSSDFQEKFDYLLDYAGIYSGEEADFFRNFREINDIHSQYSCGILKVNTNKQHVEHFRNLFYWAVMTGMFEMAMYFWEYQENAMVSALIAAKISKHCSHDCKRRKLPDEMQKSYIDNKSKFTDKVIQLQDECYKRDRRQTKELITTPIEMFGDITCLDVAIIYNEKSFVAHNSSKALCHDMWSDSADLQRYKKRKEEDNRCMQWLHKLSDPLPVVKYSVHLFGHLMFLILFAYMILMATKKSTKIGYIECYLILAVIGYAVAEIYQLSKTSGTSIRLKLWNYVTDLWNIIDCMAIFLFIVALCCRRHNDTLDIGYIFYAVSYSVWMMGILRFLLISARCGVYIIMLIKMFFKILPLLLIYLILSLGYGISTAAILVPGGNFTSVFMHITYRPYFQSMGEFLMNAHRSENQTRFGTPNRNVFVEPVALLYLAVFFLIANVLILNIVIAKFLDIYQKVLQSSSRYWQHKRFLVIMEHFQGYVAIFPPFSLIIHVVLFFKYIFCCGWTETQRNSLAYYEAKDSKDKEKRIYELRVFESKCVRKVLYKEDTILKERLLERVDETLKKVDKKMNRQNNLMVQ